MPERAEYVFYTYSNITGVENTENGQNTNQQIKNRRLIKIVDSIGRETNEKENSILFYIYSDGSVEKKIILK